MRSIIWGILIVGIVAFALSFVVTKLVVIPWYTERESSEEWKGMVAGIGDSVVQGPPDVEGPTVGTNTVVIGQRASPYSDTSRMDWLQQALEGRIDFVTRDKEWTVTIVIGKPGDIREAIDGYLLREGVRFETKGEK